MKQLFMDTSSSMMRVCLLDERKVLAETVEEGAKNHSVLLMPAVEKMMAQTHLLPKELDEIIVAKGPGSYTGVRMGVTTAKTLAWTLNCPLVLVSSLAVIASGSDKEYIVPIINARRQCVYGALYQKKDGQLIPLIKDGYYPLEGLLEKIKKQPIDEQSLAFIGEIDEFTEMIHDCFENAMIEKERATVGERLSFVPKEVIQGEAIHQIVPTYLKKVEAEEKWEETHEATNEERQSFVEKTKH